MRNINFIEKQRFLIVDISLWNSKNFKRKFIGFSFKGIIIEDTIYDMFMNSDAKFNILPCLNTSKNSFVVKLSKTQIKELLDSNIFTQPNNYDSKFFNKYLIKLKRRERIRNLLKHFEKQKDL